MDVEEIKKVYRADPFKPFGLRLKSGRLIEVLGPLRMAFVPDGKTLDIGFPDGGGVWVEIEDVVGVEMLDREPSETRPWWASRKRA
jgi:hypothetical protein